MSDDTQNTEVSLGQGGQAADDRGSVLLRAIYEEMSDMTLEELQLLYAAIILLELKPRD